MPRLSRRRHKAPSSRPPFVAQPRAGQGVLKAPASRDADARREGQGTEGRQTPHRLWRTRKIGIPSKLLYPSAAHQGNRRRSQIAKWQKTYASGTERARSGRVAGTVGREVRGMTTITGRKRPQTGARGPPRCGARAIWALTCDPSRHMSRPRGPAGAPPGRTECHSCASFATSAPTNARRGDFACQAPESHPPQESDDTPPARRRNGTFASAPPRNPAPSARHGIPPEPSTHKQGRAQRRRQPRRGTRAHMKKRRLARSRRSNRTRWEKAAEPPLWGTSLMQPNAPATT